MPEDLFSRPAPGQHGLAALRLGYPQKNRLCRPYHSHQIVTQLFHCLSTYCSGSVVCERSSTFITPGLWASRMASAASFKGNTPEINGRGSTRPERSRASAGGNGPHREPITVISFTTSGHVSTG